LSVCTTLRGMWLSAKRYWIADFVAARRNVYSLMYQLTAFLSLRMGLRGSLLTSKRPGLHIFSLYTGLLCIWFISKRHRLQILSLKTGLRGVWRTSKRPWIADFVAIHRIRMYFFYFETTLDCRFCFVAIYGTPGHLAYFETILDCRFCRYIRDSGAFGLLRNDLGLQILSLYIGLWGIWLTSKRSWIADFAAMYGTSGRLANFETTLDRDFVAIHGTPENLFYFE
jgi:hypothetical protein